MWMGPQRAKKGFYQSLICICSVIRETASEPPSGTSGSKPWPPQDLLTRTVIGCGTRRGKLYYLDLTEDSSTRLSQTHH
ncbi:hypothetical protein Prudu_022487, partial [Prunus dulcis]